MERGQRASGTRGIPDLLIQAGLHLGLFVLSYLGEEQALS